MLDVHHTMISVMVSLFRDTGLYCSQGRKMVLAVINRRAISTVEDIAK